MGELKPGEGSMWQSQRRFELERRSPMFSLSGIQLLKFAAVGALIVLSSFGNTARADELVVVGPRPGHFIPTGEAKVAIGEERVARTGNIPMAPSPVTSAKAEEAH
jgi:hypothetical protein